MDPRDIPTVPNTVPGSGEARADTPILLGHFVLGHQLGEGGMGLVFEARDTLLDRAVAVKLLHSGAGLTGAERRSSLLREAKALARLSHPNVVQVYEVGEAGVDVFVAMELLDGATLSAWLARPRPWREVLDKFIAAGRGLAAVHALELVHRDFKPSNVLLDRAGTPKVGDFGLVVHTGEGEGGPIAGTPGYMPPEQQDGRAIDARADQFAFATALEKALRTGAPARFRAILARASAADREQRYPSMTALLAELTRARRGPLRWWLAGGAVVLAAIALTIAWQVGRASSSPGAAADPCAAPVDALAPIWGDARRADLRARLVAIDPAQGGARFDAVDRATTAFVDAWIADRVSSCRANRIDGSQSDSLFDLRSECLDRALDQLRATVDVVAGVTSVAGIDGAMNAVVALPPLDACDAADALTARVPPPSDAAGRSEYDAIEREVIAIVVQSDADGKVAGLEPRAAAAVARARSLGYPHPICTSLRALSSVQFWNQETDAGLISIRDAIHACASARDDRLVAQAWIDEVRLVNKPATEHDDVAQLIPAADAAVTRAGDEPRMRFALLLLEAYGAMIGGELANARALLDQASAVLDRAPELHAQSRAALLVQEGNLAVSDQRWTDAVRYYQKSLEIDRASYGPDHPEVMRVEYNLGIAFMQLGQQDDALAAFREAARIGEARLSPGPALASTVFGVGTMLLAIGKVDEAEPYLERAVAIDRTTLPAGDPRLAEVLGNLAAAQIAVHRNREAQVNEVEAEALYAKIGKPTEGWANQLANLGYLAQVDQHDCAAAGPFLARALAMYDQIHEPMSSNLVAPLVVQARCALAARHWDVVLADTARVFALPGDGDGWHLEAHYLHGRALADGRRDVAGGVREVRAARPSMDTTEVDVGVAHDVDAWLATRR